MRNIPFWHRLEIIYTVYNVQYHDWYSATEAVRIRLCLPELDILVFDYSTIWLCFHQPMLVLLINLSDFQWILRHATEAAIAFAHLLSGSIRRCLRFDASLCFCFPLWFDFVFIFFVLFCFCIILRVLFLHLLSRFRFL